MIRHNRKSFRMKNESCEDPRELLLSLVDMGSIDGDEMLVACVSEMSDAECKRVLNSLCLPSNAEEVEEDEYEVEEPEVEPTDDVVMDDEEDMDEEEPVDELEDSEEDSDEGAAEIESRIRRLERISKRENRNRSKAKRRVESHKRKFEGIDGLTPDVDEWFSDNCDVDSYKGDEDAWLEEMQMTADGDNEDTVDNCIEAMIDEYGHDQDGLERRRGMITKRLAGLARRAIRKFNTR